MNRPVAVVAFLAPASRLALRRPHPVFAERFAMPTLRDVDAPLIAGAGIFGVGWGLAGYCPGPALTSLGSGSAGAAIFVAAMPLGMWLEAHLFEGALRK